MPVDNLIPLLYSTTPNTKPLVSTRLSGELWSNFADLQLGLIDAAQASTPLLAVRYFSPNTAYVGGDFVVQAGKIYVAKAAVPIGAFNASQWTALQTAADISGLYLPLIGGNLTGDLHTTGDYYVDGPAGTARSIFGTTAGQKRWELELGDVTGEGGSNSGSDFELIRYSDAGVALAKPALVISRAANGVAVFQTNFIMQDGATVGERGFAGYVNGKTRWIVDCGNGEPETGGNAGMNFQINRYNDSGVYTGNPVVISRATGQIQFNSPITMTVNGPGNNTIDGPNGSTRGLWSSTNGSTRWLLNMGTLASETGGNVGSDFGLQCYADNGTLIGIPLSISRAGMAFAIGGPLTVNGTITGNSTLTLASTINCVNLVGVKGSSFPQYQISNASNVILGAYFATSGNVYMQNQTNSSNCACIGSVNMFQVSGGAQKPGGGAWIDSSDIRIKNITGDYTSGLDAILQLRPVLYTFKGNDTPTDDVSMPRSPPKDENEIAPTITAAPYPSSPHYLVAVEEQEYVGFIAQELETVFPDMVNEREGYIDGNKVADLKDVDTTNLIYALVNAVKTLTARVVELEARAG